MKNLKGKLIMGAFEILFLTAMVVVLHVAEYYIGFQAMVVVVLALLLTGNFKNNSIFDGKICKCNRKEDSCCKAEE